jgi:hypothetical protein
MSAATFPRQDITETERNAKDKSHYKQCIDYAIDRFHNYGSARNAKIKRMYDGYNGVNSEAALKPYNFTYGNKRANKVKYIDYRLCRTMIDKVIGEQLEMPINGTVYTTNPDAKVRRLEEVSVLAGMHYARKEIEQLRNMVNVDVFNGMPIPEVAEGESVFSLMPKKSQNEAVMQTIIERQIDLLKMRVIYNMCCSDLTLTSGCFMKVGINEEGLVYSRSIPAEDAMYEESKRDPFLDRSPYIGEQRIMFLHDIITEYNPSKEIRDTLAAYASDTGTIPNDMFSRNYEMDNGVLGYRVYTIEWIGLETSYIKKYKDKDGNDREIIVSNEYFEENEKRINREIRNGKYVIEKRYKQALYEATRIGHDTYINMRKVKNIPTSWNNPTWTMRTYVGLLFNTVGGTRVSLKQMTEHIDKTYNMVMWQIRREMAKAKGKQIAFDLALLPRGYDLKTIFYNMSEEGVIVYNSSDEGNLSGKDGGNSNPFKEFDIGISQTVGVLIPLKIELERMAERITGITPDRMGDIKASSTAYGAQQSIAASRTITAPMFFYFNEFIERSLRLMCELTKISWGVLRPEKGDMVLGAEMQDFLMVTSDIAFDDYGFALADSSKEMRIREMIRAYMPQVLNANPELLPEVVEAELKNTVSEVIGVYRKAVNEVRKINAAAQQAEREAREAEAQIKNGAIVQASAQSANAQLASQGIKAVADVAKQGQKASDQMVLDMNNQAAQQSKRR